MSVGRGDLAILGKVLGEDERVGGNIAARWATQHPIQAEKYSTRERLFCQMPLMVGLLHFGS